MEKQEKIWFIQKYIWNKEIWFWCKILYKEEEFIVIKKILFRNQISWIYVTSVSRTNNLLSVISDVKNINIIWSVIKKEDIEKFIIETNDLKSSPLINRMNSLWIYWKTFEDQSEKLFDFVIENITWIKK